MIDQLLHCDKLKAVSCLNIRPDNIFCSKGLLAEPGLIENIAQTAAAKMGYNTIRDKQNESPVKPQIGYIAAIKNLQIHFLPEIHSKITTEIRVDDEVLGFILLYGKVISSGRIAAECELRIFMS